MLVFTKFYIALYIWSVIYLVNATDYCDPKFCENKSHTLCTFKHDGPAPNCLNYERFIKSDKDKEEIVNKINSRRNKVASGDIRSLPSASNMMKVKWNEELAISAQRWADQCESGPDLADSCRNLENSPVGQNIATLYGEVADVKPSTLVDLWYMELLHINPAIISNYQPSSARHLKHHDYFTQLVWSETTDVGCGAVQFQERFPGKLNKSRTVYRLVCNFMPCGNIEGKHVYNEGPPCTSCGLNAKCDSTHKYLCEQRKKVFKNRIDTEGTNDRLLLNNTKSNKLENETNMTNSSLNEVTELETGVDSDITFDLFSYLFNTDENTTTPHTEITRLCKDVLFVDEFMDILRKKLSTDNVLKEMLMSTKTPQSDMQYSDAKVDAIVSKIYSQKTTPTTTKSTVSESINSTLLVDLVEAVIFRSRDKISTVEDVSLLSDGSIDARTVQMQAELAETRQNQEFTGHYFFPEEEDHEENVKEHTEPYYDSSVIPISEIELEIEELKRNRGTKDFIDDILETDLYTESTTQNNIMTFDDNKESASLINNNNEDAINLWKQPNDPGLPAKSKREVKANPKIRFLKKSLKNNDDVLINYNELIKILAWDLKDLKLNEKFHCSCNLASTFTFSRSFMVLLIAIMNLN